MRLRVLDSFVNVDSSVVRCLALAVQRQHVAVAVALWFVALALVVLLTSLSNRSRYDCVMHTAVADLIALS